MTKPRTLFELSIDTRTVLDLLIAAPVGETVTFATIGAALGHPVSGGHPNVQSALRRVEKTEGLVFGNIRGVGYRRLDDAAIVATSERARQSIRGHARRAGARITRVGNFLGLSDQDKVRHNAYLSVFGAIGIMTKPKNLEKLEHAVQSAAAQLPLARTLEVFRS